MSVGHLVGVGKEGVKAVVSLGALVSSNDHGMCSC